MCFHVFICFFSFFPLAGKEPLLESVETGGFGANDSGWDGSMRGTHWWLFWEFGAGRKNQMGGFRDVDVQSLPRDEPTDSPSFSLTIHSKPIIVQFSATTCHYHKKKKKHGNRV